MLIEGPCLEPYEPQRLTHSERATLVLDQLSSEQRRTIRCSCPDGEVIRPQPVLLIVTRLGGAYESSLDKFSPPSSNVIELTQDFGPRKFIRRPDPY